MRLKFVFSSKSMKTIQIINQNIVPLNNADEFFITRKCHLSLIRIIEIMFSFAGFKLRFEM